MLHQPPPIAAGHHFMQPQTTSGFPFGQLTPDFFNQMENNPAAGAFYSPYHHGYYPSLESFKLDDRMDMPLMTNNGISPLSQKSSSGFKSPEEKDPKQVERRVRNNKAARESRVKRKEREMQLKNQVDQLVAENEKLKAMVKRLEQDLNAYAKAANSINTWS